MNLAIVIALAYLSNAAVRSQAELYDYDVSTIVSKRYDLKRCGAQLASLLSDVCGGQYNSLFKKSVIFGDMDGDDKVYEQENEPTWPLMSRHRASSLLGAADSHQSHHYRSRRGVYDECCKKSCSINELMGYCRKSPSTNRNPQK